MNKLFPTQEIGSLAKPNWRVKPFRGMPLTKEDIAEMKHWAKLLGIEHAELEKLLGKKELSNEEKLKLKDYASIFALRFFEKAGLDIVYDGEQKRSEMYQHAVDNIAGFEYVGLVRSFDNKYYKKASCKAKPRLKRFYHLDEFIFVKEHAERIPKVPITGAYTIADWSFNEFYLKKSRSKTSDMKRANYDAKRELTLELAKHIIRPNIKALVHEGATYIQIDEPAATTKPSEVPIVVEAFNESIKGLKAKFSCHICFSDYSLLFPHVLEMNCEQLALEFANKCKHAFEGYEILKLFNEYGYDKEIGLGVLDVHSDSIESVATVKARIEYATKHMDSAKIYVNPDCGLRTRSWDVAFKKLRNMVEACKLVRREFGEE
jgi:5-methyltetrahydropteroyltriglutamate--homocysteine methyltransferase